MYYEIHYFDIPYGETYHTELLTVKGIEPITTFTESRKFKSRSAAVKWLDENPDYRVGQYTPVYITEEF